MSVSLSFDKQQCQSCCIFALFPVYSLTTGSSSFEDPSWPNSVREEWDGYRFILMCEMRTIMEVNHISINSFKAAGFACELSSIYDLVGAEFCYCRCLRETMLKCS